jgi:hypothetical protein
LPGRGTRRAHRTWQRARASLHHSIIFARICLASAKIKRSINLNKALRYEALGCAVTYRTDDDELDDTPVKEPGRGPLYHIVVTVMLVCFGSGGALVSRAYGLTLPALPAMPSFTSTASTPAASPAAPVAAKAVAPSDLQVLQQQLAASVQTNERLLAAQQAQQVEIKRLSDQVAALSGKLDLLQRPMAAAQAALPAAAPNPASAPKPVVAAKPKKPTPVQSTGTISTGGAPLPPPVSLTR